MAWCQPALKGAGHPKGLSWVPPAPLAVCQTHTVERPWTSANCQENPQMPGVYAQKGDREALQLYSNKGRVFTGAYACGIFSLGVSEDAASLYPKFPATCCPFPFPTGWGTGKVQPSKTAYHISPLESAILLQRSQTQVCAAPCLFQEPSCPGSATNLLPKASGDIKPHFQDINTHTFVHQFVRTWTFLSAWKKTKCFDTKK